MKASALRDMTKEELLQRERELREAMFNLRFQHATGQLENSAQLRKTRIEIAQVLTMLRELDLRGKA